MKDIILKSLANVLYVGVGTVAFTTTKVVQGVTVVRNEGESCVAEVKRHYDARKAKADVAERVDDRQVVVDAWSSL
jgi:4-hydroxyphenylpyruvate dioxygenase-like putative hemolysin